VVIKTAILVAIMITVDTAWLFIGGALTRCFQPPAPRRLA